MTPITLPDRDLLLEALSYDPEAGTLLWKKRPPEHFNWRSHEYRRWNTRYSGAPASYLTEKGYMRVKFRGKMYMAHRLIWKMMTGEEPQQVDHINGDRSNNKWENLRDVTPQDNSKNRKAQDSTISGEMGVHRNGSGWLAYISNSGKRIVLGTYPTIGEAAAARRRAERDLGFHPNHGRRASILGLPRRRR